tara:strand:- start:325 stop:492 length:168 start_codon:yes stop_codon:yes gene_type:complete
MKVPNRKKNERKKIEREAGWNVFICPNCEEPTANGGHYVPPGLGDPGWFICKKKE